ncbi:hypothetical protein OV203_26025 [Nannocystis sp. ILAH1]|uniref:hypothetical protein n=1 Tax=Nannocystis sp. ILAH1 TaxID=2996789 RepID=UPI002270A2C2|nr:hypothetical protein [Nannocystis sp. ILAH1]MCY0990628.1 hypothetical protein [Nannocystis sp. ILAH1]
MAHTSKWRDWLAFYPEVTPCVEPPNGWVTDGTCIEFLAIDLGNVKQTLLPDPTLETRWSHVGGRRLIKGRRNVDWSATLKWHGTGTTTDPASQVEQTYLGTLLQHCMGGVHRSNSTLLTGGSATEPEVTAVDNIVPGCIIWFEDTTSPNPQYAGKLTPRQVLEINDLVLTLDAALPWTPAAGDIAHGTITPYVGENYLIDAVASQGTMMWFHKKNVSGTDLLWQLEGSVASFALQNLGPGQLPQLQLNMMSANFKQGGEDGLTNPAFTTIVGNAQLSTSRDIMASISVYDNTTETLIHVNNATFEVGFARSKTETTTEIIHRFEGLSTYSVTPGVTKLTLTLTEYDDAWYGALQDDVDYRVRLWNPGDGSGAGKAWCIHLSKCQLAENPVRTDVGDVNGITLVFQSMIPDNVDPAGNVDLETSRFHLALG